MKIEQIKGIQIDAVVACLPETLIDNLEACRPLFGDKTETLIKATGIHARAIAKQGTTALDLNVHAAKEALEISKTDPTEIGAVISVSFTPEYLMPSDAPGAQVRLGLPKDVLAFDVNMACSGYGYGIYLAGLIAQSTKKKVLLLDGDVQSAYVSTKDKSTMPVMADAGSATIISPSEGQLDPFKFAFHTDGSNRKDLYIPAGGSKQALDTESLTYISREDGSARSDANIFMDGFAIFKFVAQTASRFLSEFLEQTSIAPENIHNFVPHQANMYMIEQLAKKLRISPNALLRSGHKYGNPASASIPLTIAENRNRFVSKTPIQTFISGFGGGLSISAALVYLSSETKIKLVKYAGESIG